MEVFNILLFAFVTELCCDGTQIFFVHSIIDRFIIAVGIHPGTGNTLNISENRNSHLP